MAGTNDARITSVFWDMDWEIEGDPKYSELACRRLEIHLSNGQVVWVSLKPKENDPQFAYMRDDPLLYRPIAGGDRVYWQDGPSLLFDEIMEMVVESSQAADFQ